MGETPSPTNLPFSCFAPNAFGAKQEKGRYSFLDSLPRAALRLPGAIIISSLRDFGLARSARKLPNCDSATAGSLIQGRNSPVLLCVSPSLSAAFALSIRLL